MGWTGRHQQELGTTCRILHLCSAVQLRIKESRAPFAFTRMGRDGATFARWRVGIHMGHPSRFGDSGWACAWACAITRARGEGGGQPARLWPKAKAKAYLRRDVRCRNSLLCTSHVVAEPGSQQPAAREETEPALVLHFVRLQRVALRERVSRYPEAESGACQSALVAILVHTIEGSLVRACTSRCSWAVHHMLRRLLLLVFFVSCFEYLA